MSGSQAAAHEHGHRPSDNGFAGVGAPFEVTDQTLTLQEPGEGSFHDPAPGQDLKAADVVAAADDVEHEVEVVGSPVLERTAIATVRPDPGQLWQALAGSSWAASRSVVDAGVTSTSSRSPSAQVSRWRLRPLICWAGADLVEAPSRCRSPASARRPPLIRALGPQRRLTCADARRRYRERSLDHR